MGKPISGIIERFVALGLLGFAATSGQAQTVHTIELDGVQFIPANVSINVGDTVHWVWVSGFHNVESGVIEDDVGVPDDNFRSGDPTLEAGATFDVVFDANFLSTRPMPGNSYPYYCVVHATLGMAGAIAVLIPGDIDGDTDVDLDDHRILVGCMTGPNSSTPSGACNAGEFDLADIDGDGDVDLWDAAAMQRSHTG